MVQPLWRTVWRLLIKLKIELPYDPQQSLSWAYIQRKPYLNRYWIPMLIVALFTIARRWKQPKCPSTDEWINKM